MADAISNNQFHHPPPTVYQPLTQTISVIGPQYLAPYPVDLTITEKTSSLTDGDYTVTDVNGNIVFKVKGKLLSLRDKRFLVDASGNTLVTMRQKPIFTTAHDRWQAFRGKSTDSNDLLFSVKRSAIIQSRTELDVFFAKNISEEACDLKIKGGPFEGSCNIFHGNSDVVVALPVACQVWLAWLWWYIWKAWNNIIFRCQPWYPQSILKLSSQAIHNWQVSTHLIKTLSPSALPAENWQPPHGPYYKFNIDGSYNYQTKTSGIRGILRDHSGTIIQAFAAVTNGESTLEAELKAMLRGSRLCLTLGIKNVIFEGNSYIVWNSLVSELGMPWTLMPLWKKLRDSLDKIPSWHVLLTRRDANRVADALAKLGPPLEMLFDSSLPIHIQDIYLQELCLQEERTMPLDQQM